MRRTAVGASWVIGWRMATRVIGLVSSLVLIRLLLPADFGLVALATVFVIAVDTLSELGVEDSLVREANPTPALYATAFTLTLIRGVVTAALILGLSLPAARFFDEPRLAQVLWALSLSSLVGALENTGIADFRRDMRFDKEFRLQLVPRLVALFVTIGAALVWRSYWALIAGMLAGRVTRTVFSYSMHPWRPSLSLAAWRDLLGYTSWSWALSLMFLARDRLDTFVLGRTLDATAVGTYAIGEEIGTLPTIEMVSPIGRACFSSFAAARAAGTGLEAAYMRPVAFATMLALPAGLGLSLVADPLVRVVIGEQWLAAVPVLQIFGVIGSLSVPGGIAGTLLGAAGLLRQRFIIGAGAVALRVALVVPLVLQLGVTGAALGVLAGTLVEHGVCTAVAFRRFGFSWAGLVGGTWRTVVAGVAMVAVLAGSGLGWSALAGDVGRQAWLLALTCGLGAGTFGGALLGLWLWSGRPAGAEADLLGILRGGLARVTRRLRPRGG